MHSFKSFLKEQSKNENIGSAIVGIAKGIGKHIGKNKLPYAGGAAGGALIKKAVDNKELIKKVAIGGAGAYAAKKTYDAVKNRKTGSGGTNFPKNQERIRQMQKRYGHPGNNDA